MNTNSSVKLVKKAKPKNPAIQTEVEVVDNPNRWSRAVQSWISEFRQDRRAETMPAFNSLFK
jgi:hypothetical protein